MSRSAPRAIIVAGLPGSGKTELLESRRKSACIFDDFKANAIDDSSAFDHAKKLPELIERLRAGGTCIISDIDFCHRSSQLEAVNYLRAHVPDLVIEWICFENAPEPCKANIRRRAAAVARNEALELANVDRYAPDYSIPAGATILPVWRP